MLYEQHPDGFSFRVSDKIEEVKQFEKSDLYAMLLLLTYTDGMCRQLCKLRLIGVVSHDDFSDL